MRAGTVFHFRDFSTSQLQALFMRGMKVRFNIHTLFYDKINYPTSPYRYTTRGNSYNSSFEHCFRSYCAPSREAFECMVITPPSTIYRRQHG